MSRAGHFTSGGGNSTHCTGDWLGPWAGIDGCGKPRPNRESISGQSSP